LNSYPLNEESDTLKTKSLSLTTLICGLIGDISWEDPPVDAILTIEGGDETAS